MKTRNKLEKEGQKGLTSFQGQKPCKKLEGKRQKNVWWSPEPTQRERKARNYLKSDFEKVQFCLLKLIHEFRSVENQLRPVETDRDTLSQILKNFKNFDRSKNRMDRSNQAETHHFQGKTQFLKKQDDLTQSIEF